MIIAPTNRDANYNLGLLLLYTGSPAVAITHLQRVRPLDTQTRLNLVRAYLQAGKTTEGLRGANALSLEKKKDLPLHFTLGMLLACEKQYQSGSVELEKADALQPETFEILYNLGQ